jgi:hypothetical protein
MHEKTGFNTTQLLMQEGDRVLAIRTTEDIKAYEQILNVLLGTQIRHVQEQSIGTLAMLDEEGFDQQDISVLLEADPYYPACGIKLDESSVRYTSVNERRQTLTSALTAQAITPDTYAQGMAELDQALTLQDKYMKQQIDKRVNRCLLGEPWVPMPMGAYNTWCINSLTKAQFDDRVAMDPMAQQRLAQGIQAQQQMMMQEQMATNPEIQMQMMMAQQQQPAPEEQPQTLEDVLTQAGA